MQIGAPNECNLWRTRSPSPLEDTPRDSLALLIQLLGHGAIQHLRCSDGDEPNSPPFTGLVPLCPVRHGLCPPYRLPCFPGAARA
eukprot:scaffold20339_cov120-Isochrysis_galbana.AAC.11